MLSKDLRSVNDVFNNKIYNNHNNTSRSNHCHSNSYKSKYSDDNNVKNSGNSKNEVPKQT